MHSTLQINQSIDTQNDGDNNNSNTTTIASTIMSCDYFNAKTSESFSSIEEEYHVGNNICISLNFSSYSKIQSVYSNLSQDGEIAIPLSKQFWNAYFSHFTDRFGINWYLNLHLPSECKSFIPFCYSFLVLTLTF